MLNLFKFFNIFIQIYSIHRFTGLKKFIKALNEMPDGEKDDTTIMLTINSDTAYVNGTAQTMLKAPEIINGSTMILNDIVV